MKRNVKIVMDWYSVMRMLLFIISHYLCVKYDFYNPGNSVYQSYYFPLIVSIAFLSSSLLAFLISYFMSIQNFVLHLVLIDFLGCILILIDFDFDIYISLVYVTYGAFVATLVYNFFKKNALNMKEKTAVGMILQELKPSFKKIIPMLIGIIAKNQKFNKTPADEKRIDDIVNNI